MWNIVVFVDFIAQGGDPSGTGQGQLHLIVEVSISSE